MEHSPRTGPASSYQRFRGRRSAESWSSFGGLPVVDRPVPAIIGAL